MMTPLNSIINLSQILKKNFEASNSPRDSAFKKIKKGKTVIKDKSVINNQYSDPFFLIKIINNSAVLMKYLVQDSIDLMKIIKGELKPSY
jgi:hypothetical protein